MAFEFHMQTQEGCVWAEPQHQFSGDRGIPPSSLFPTFRTPPPLLSSLPKPVLTFAAIQLLSLTSISCSHSVWNDTLA